MINSFLGEHLFEGVVEAVVEDLVVVVVYALKV